eukprot:TRINITY_DN30422_c0_g1_i1.p1 TRINITY_DN30422_c0_g1~~TRINITY_DN30422_c0_g1_i1.p1  ORF type:complete len:562 (+),score=172.81 TRINITY_DN30422_c0_g1_i1:64-1749(+)
MATAREKWKKEQATLEAQREGQAPPDMDEDGNVINPHIPQYMAKPPWWLGYDEKTLKHQRKVPSTEEARATGGIKDWYARGGTTGEAATKYRKGACRNCGAMSHKEKECTERPRKLKAVHSGKNIARDEIVSDVTLSWEGKHDRWNGVDLDQHQREVTERHNIVDMQRRQLKQEQAKAKILEMTGTTEEEVSANEKRMTTLIGEHITRDNIVMHKPLIAEKIKNMSNDSEQDEAKKTLVNLLSVIPISEGGLAEDDAIAELMRDQDKEQEDINAAEGVDALTNNVDLGGVRDGVEAKVTARNLRIREDTAKYLRNLSMDPAFHYDPKTRSQRANPYPDKNPDEVDYAGDNWVRSTGDAQTVDKLQVFCWDTTRKLQDKGTSKYVNMQANPTQAEKAFKADLNNKENLKSERENELLKRYGGAEHLKALPDELRVASEGYTEYRPDGSLLKGTEKAAQRSKYEEDKMNNNHTTVWGSYWDAGQWGYKCCKQTIKNCICLGKKLAGDDQKENEKTDQEQLMLEEMKKMEAQLLLAGQTAAENTAKRPADDVKESNAKKQKSSR